MLLVKLRIGKLGEDRQKVTSLGELLMCIARPDVYDVSPSYKIAQPFGRLFALPACGGVCCCEIQGPSHNLANTRDGHGCSAEGNGTRRTS